MNNFNSEMGINSCALLLKGQWMPATAHSIPSGAIQGGHDQDGSPIYVARAYHESDLIPGENNKNNVSMH